MTTLQLVLTSILPLAGVGLGAFLQFYFSRSTEDRKQLQSLRIQAYTDYLRCVAENASLISDAQMAELSARIADSKTRIAIFGSANVVEALSDFERGGPITATPESMSRFLAIAGHMREETGGADAVPDDHLHAILFGVRDTP